MSTPDQAPPPEGYEPFFGLREAPFGLAPDPRFLFASASHSAALAQVTYALERREPLVVVTGEIGTGKTLLCRTVLQRLERKTFLSIINDPLLERDELLKQLLQDFGVIPKGRGSATAASRHDLAETLHTFLQSLVPIQAHAVVIIDEAQHLRPEVLEQIRLLSNTGDERGTLLQIILVGQTDLEALLARPELRQMQQRISRRLRLEPLTSGEVRDYIEHRIALARAGRPSQTPGAAELSRALAEWSGPTPNVEFAPDAIEAILRFSAGLPRVINLLCDRSLEQAHVFRLHAIDGPLVHMAARALGIRVPPALSRTVSAPAVPSASADTGAVRKGTNPPSAPSAPIPSAMTPSAVAVPPAEPSGATTAATPASATEPTLPAPTNVVPVTGSTHATDLDTTGAHAGASSVPTSDSTSHATSAAAQRDAPVSEPAAAGDTGRDAQAAFDELARLVASAAADDSEQSLTSFTSQEPLSAIGSTDRQEEVEGVSGGDMPSAPVHTHLPRAAGPRLARGIALAASAVLATTAIWFAVRPAHRASPPVSAPTTTRSSAPPPIARAEPSAAPATTPPPAAPTAPPPKPAASSASPTAGVTPTTPSPADPAAQRFDVIVASFRTETRAAAIADQVSALGLPVRRRVADGWQQIICGPFSSRADAESAQQRLDREGLSGAQIVPVSR